MIPSTESVDCKSAMAAHMISSALFKTIPKNDGFAHGLLRHNIQRNIQQRRKARSTLPVNFQVLSCCYHVKNDRITGPGPIREAPIAVAASNPHRSSVFHTLTGVFRVSCGWIRPWNQTRWLTTSGARGKAGETREQSPAVGTWNAVREKKNQFREAGQDLLDDIKEKKAKVREKMDAIIERENIWTIPNLLCVSRIGMSPYLCHLVLSMDYDWALGLFMFAGFTDLLDGWIARTFPSQASRLGSFLDPLADKVLVAMLFLSLTYVGLIPLPLTGLIIYRDVLIIGGASYVRYKSLPPPKTITRYFDATHATAQLAPTTISKVNTAIQLSLITASLAAPVFDFTDHYLLTSLCWLTAATTLSSGISYIFSKNTYKILDKMKK